MHVENNLNLPCNPFDVKESFNTFIFLSVVNAIELHLSFSSIP